jgi:hypothetical protein
MTSPGKANPRYANGHRRRQVMAKVYREETECGICHETVDKTLPYLNPRTGKPDPMSKSVDEIVPVSLGGSPIDRRNARLAHLGCNQKRGNGTRVEVTTVKRVRAY